MNEKFCNNYPLIRIFARDSNWDVNDYLLLLKSNLKSWRNVYWRYVKLFSCSVTISSDNTDIIDELLKYNVYDCGNILF